LTDQDFIKSE